MGGILGTIAGAALAAPTGGMSMLAGAQLGGMLGGTADELLGGGTSGTNPNQTSNVQTYPSIPPYMQGDFNTLHQAAQNIYNTPYQAYGGEGVAPFTQDQLNSFQGVRNMQGQYQPLMNSASSMALQAGQGYQNGLTQSDLDTFMNPYQQGVIDITKRNAQTDSDTQLAQLRSRQAGAGTYGGSRGAILESTLMNNNARNLSDIQMTGSAANYNQALQAVMNNRQGLMNSATGIANLAGQGQTMGYRDLGALSAQGDQQQQLQQQQDAYAMQQFAAQKAYPQQQFDQYNSFLQQMMGKNTVGTATQNPATPSSLQTLMGFAGLGGSNVGQSLSSGLSSLFGNSATPAYGIAPGNGTYGPVAAAQSGSGLMGLFSGMGFADGGLVPRRKFSHSSGIASVADDSYAQGLQSGQGYKSGGLVDYLRSVIDPAPGSRAQDVLNYLGTPSKSTQQREAELHADMASQAASALRPFATANEYLFGANKPSLADAWQHTGTDPAEQFGPAYTPKPINSDNQLLTQTDSDWTDTASSSDVPAVDTKTADNLSTRPSIAKAEETDTEVNRPLLRFGIQMLTGGGKNNVVAFGKGMEAYANTMDSNRAEDMANKKLAIEAMKASSDVNLQTAQAKHFTDSDKMAIEQLKAETKLSTSEEHNLYALAQTYAQSGQFEDPMGQAIQDMRKVKLKSGLSFIQNSILTGRASKDEVTSRLTPNMVKQLYQGSELTKEQATAIISKYFQ